MENILSVKTTDGQVWQIMILDTFMVEDYPNKNYIVYTFGEQENPETVKSYISILDETENYFALEGIANEEEKEIVKEAYQNMLLESGELEWQE